MDRFLSLNDWQDLIAWFTDHKTEHAFRSRDPYRVWISEVALQQTRIAAALPVLQGFFSRFPDLQSLAAAPVDDVIASWSGLGYYQRARNLHSAARKIAALGGFPEDTEGWLALPGVGAYTAAAVCSICYRIPVPVIDGNVRRIVARILGIDNSGDPAIPEFVHRSFALIGDLHPGDINEALMQLGQRVCQVRSPRCMDCIWRERCTTRSDRLPLRRRLNTVSVDWQNWILFREGQVLLIRSPFTYFLKSAWQFPSAVFSTETSKQIWSAASAIPEGQLSFPGLRARITHHKISLSVNVSDSLPVFPGHTELLWVRADDLEARLISSALRRIWRFSRNVL